MASAPGFQLVITPSNVLAKIASLEQVTIDAISAIDSWARQRSCSARFTVTPVQATSPPNITTVNTVIRESPVHSENIPAISPCQRSQPTTSGIAAAAGNSRRVNVPPKAALAISAPNPEPLRAHAIAADRRTNTAAVKGEM